MFATEKLTLVLFAPDNPYQCSSILRGELRGSDRGYVSFPLPKLKRRVRIQGADPRLAFRYYADNVHDAALSGGNCLLLSLENSHVAFWIPGAP